MTGKRHNGEGSIFPYRNGFAAYVWVTKPDGTRTRKYVYGQEREEVHAKWIKLHEEAKKGPVATKAMTVGKFAAYWLAEIVEPNLSPGSYSIYESASRLYIVPGLGNVRLDRLRPTDVQTWLNNAARACQCCTQGKDARRQLDKRRCCSLGRCCNNVLKQSSVAGLRRAIRAMLTSAIDSDMITKNVAKQTKLPTARKVRRTAWSSEEARRFLEQARSDDQRFYAAYVLILLLGLRKGEVLGLTWEQIDLGTAEVNIVLQLQRVGRRLLHREVKSESSEATLPLPQLALAALARHRELVADDLGEAPSGLLFTTRTGLPVEPRNFNRFWDRQIKRAGVKRITVHDARRTCATLLRDLNVHPRVAQQILRHAQVAITMEIYTEVTDEATRDALRKLGESLG
ncbi:tyrosine-type recombinase/integrase [Catellatospora sichuanensis]|uniref:tyrosine-type recombinase/integrase n=1 Tax=Catellatospora sichuanensis TaxID=1969805 RepID=UPI00118298AE|nr:site-specific integrase [Catellatospora sichuanensis]